jgi:hypothetical protein
MIGRMAKNMKKRPFKKIFLNSFISPLQGGFFVSKK